MINFYNGREKVSHIMDKGCASYQHLQYNKSKIILATYIIVLFNRRIAGKIMLKAIN